MAAPRSLPLALLAYVAFFGGMSKAQDPCQNYTMLPSENQRYEYVVDSSAAVCDLRLPPAWYRPSLNDSELASTCPDIGHCGTSFPAWMNGSVPSVAEGEVTRTVCETSVLSCCSASHTISVKNCGAFPVYYLVPLSACPMGYCLVNNTAIPPPTSNLSSTAATSSTMTPNATAGTAGTSSITPVVGTAVTAATPVSLTSETASTLQTPTSDAVGTTSSKEKTPVEGGEDIKGEGLPISTMIAVVTSVAGGVIIVIAVLVAFVCLRRRKDDSRGERTRGLQPGIASRPLEENDYASMQPTANGAYDEPYAVLGHVADVNPNAATPGVRADPTPPRPGYTMNHPGYLSMTGGRSGNAGRAGEPPSEAGIVTEGKAGGVGVSGDKTGYVNTSGDKTLYDNTSGDKTGYVNLSGDKTGYVNTSGDKNGYVNLGDKSGTAIISDDNTGYVAMSNNSSVAKADDNTGYVALSGDKTNYANTSGKRSGNVTMSDDKNGYVNTVEAKHGPPALPANHPTEETLVKQPWNN